MDGLELLRKVGIFVGLSVRKLDRDGIVSGDQILGRSIDKGGIELGTSDGNTLNDGLVPLDDTDGLVVAPSVGRIVSFIVGCFAGFGDSVSFVGTTGIGLVSPFDDDIGVGVGLCEDAASLNVPDSSVSAGGSKEIEKGVETETSLGGSADLADGRSVISK
jgi:hypothetical protein